MKMKKLENVEIERREELNEWCQKNETVTNEMESVSTVEHVWEEEVLGKERSNVDDKREDCCVVS